MSSIAKLTKLNWLNLVDNKIEDLSPLTSLTNLTTLWLSNNQISDITPLLENTDLSGKINLQNNPISNTALTTHIPALRARGISVYHDYIPSDIVTLKDTNLKKAIREDLGIQT